ncbi:hypothetical protein LXT21_33015 [Myxococcus sp. K38C18041901]|uniref:hypothetical protein n=1 Tax=Myxococcus guangdongensis TaxID=2906760 RepID=UPI0020A70DF7|nr:hypothetical protein [Myxococcus guangdongensis]MCP3063608.1 hypothetical protein [Myxococcus guangdongensis]
MNWRYSFLFALFGVVGCGHASITPLQAARLATPAASHGELIYIGTVTPEGSTIPAFRYERRVLERANGERVSTHITFADDTPVVLQQATQDEGGRLIAFEEVHGQRGEAHHFAGGERGDANIVVGPTLFGFARTHLRELRAGQAVPLVFWDRGSEYAFELTLTGDTVQMRATSFFVALAVSPIEFRLGPGEQVVAYRGRVPPLRDGRATDADVTYVHLAPFR